MTPNKLAVYIVANIDFPSGRYRLAVADRLWSVADMAEPQLLQLDPLGQLTPALPQTL